MPYPSMFKLVINMLHFHLAFFNSPLSTLVTPNKGQPVSKNYPPHLFILPHIL